jgi:hypothetical protein
MNPFVLPWVTSAHVRSFEVFAELVRFVVPQFSLRHRSGSLHRYRCTKLLVGNWQRIDNQQLSATLSSGANRRTRGHPVWTPNTVGGAVIIRPWFHHATMRVVLWRAQKWLICWLWHWRRYRVDDDYRLFSTEYRCASCGLYWKHRGLFRVS